MEKGGGLDIAKNIRLVEWLKSEILTSVAELYQLLAAGQEFPRMPGRLPGKHNYSSLPSRQKAGNSFAAIDSKIESKIRLGIIEEHDVENTMVILQPSANTTGQGNNKRGAI